ncbi:MAG: family 16 glycoside hydrolase, partial [Chitinophagia bacterium]
MSIRICLSLMSVLFFSNTITAQKVKPRLKLLPLQSLEGFQSPASNWKIMGAVQAGYNDTILNTATGEGVLFNDYTRSIQFQPGRNLMTKMEHGDIVIELDIMIPKGSNSGLYLQSRYEVQINDSWG